MAWYSEMYILSSAVVYGTDGTLSRNSILLNYNGILQSIALTERNLLAVLYCIFLKGYPI